MAYEKTTVKYNGILREFELAELDLLNPSDPSDEELLQALCIALDIPNLNEYEIRRADTVINVQPEALHA